MNRCKSVIEFGRRRFLTGAGVAATGWLALVAARSSRCLLNAPGSQYIDP
jgi:hypothetical protein